MGKTIKIYYSNGEMITFNPEHVYYYDIQGKRDFMHEGEVVEYEGIPIRVADYVRIIVREHVTSTKKTTDGLFVTGVQFSKDAYQYFKDMVSISIIEVYDGDKLLEECYVDFGEGGSTNNKNQTNYLYSSKEILSGTEVEIGTPESVAKYGDKSLNINRFYKSLD